MDFEKIKAATEDIKLTDAEKENIILLCEESKKTKKKSRFVPVAAAAAVAVFAFVIVSPGFLLKASEADKNFATQENAVANDYELLADSAEDAAGVILHSSTTENPDLKTDNGGGYIESGKYRQRYNNVPYDFIVLVGEKEFDRWYDEIYEFNPDKSQIVSFVQYFNISKEVFEKTNLQMAKSFAEFNPTMRPMDYENQQIYEIYNADIIYTFDDEIINEYYLTTDYPYCADFEYEAAVKRGEYTSQTEVWIDIEQIEAEIIAKYGEAEIVTEQP